MSRREIPARHPDHTVFVGWDQPLLTFFLQVYDRTKDEEENPVVWLGAGRPRELYEVEDLQGAVRPYADLAATMAATLYGDRDEGR